MKELPFDGPYHTRASHTRRIHHLTTFQVGDMYPVVVAFVQITHVGRQIFLKAKQTSTSTAMQTLPCTDGRGTFDRRPGGES